MGEVDRPHRARKPRRAVRSATDGVPENERDMIDDPLNVDESDRDAESNRDAAQPKPASPMPDAWWHEQRPPHWG